MCSFKIWMHMNLNWLFDIDLTSNLTFNSINIFKIRFFLKNFMIEFWHTFLLNQYRKFFMCYWITKLIFNKKYVYSKYERMIIKIDDLTFQIFQHWSSLKLHANCDFFIFLLITSIITSKNISNFIYLFFVFVFVFVFIMIFIIRFFCNVHYNIVNFDNNLFKHLRTNHWNLIENDVEKIVWKTVWKIVERKIFTNCMFVLFWNWIYDKKYMFWTHATIKYARKKRIFEIIVVEISFEKKNNVTIRILTTFISFTWYHMFYHRSSIRKFWRFANSYFSF